jgi:hypothetical protein
MEPNKSGPKYAHIYNITPRTVNPNEDIPFDSNGPLTHDAIIHNYGSSVIIIKAHGTYKVTFSLSSATANQVALHVNNNYRYGTLYGNDAGFQNVGQAIIQLCEGDVLSLRNMGQAPIQLSSQPVDVYGLINASMVIESV